MKKIAALILVLLLLAGCGQPGAASTSSSSGQAASSSSLPASAPASSTVPISSVPSPSSLPGAPPSSSSSTSSPEPFTEDQIVFVSPKIRFSSFSGSEYALSYIRTEGGGISSTLTAENSIFFVYRGTLYYSDPSADTIYLVKEDVYNIAGADETGLYIIAKDAEVQPQGADEQAVSLFHYNPVTEASTLVIRRAQQALLIDGAFFYAVREPHQYTGLDEGRNRDLNTLFALYKVPAAGGEAQLIFRDKPLSHPNYIVLAHSVSLYPLAGGVQAYLQYPKASEFPRVRLLRFSLGGTLSADSDSTPVPLDNILTVYKDTFHPISREVKCPNYTVKISTDIDNDRMTIDVVWPDKTVRNLHTGPTRVCYVAKDGTIFFASFSGSRDWAVFDGETVFRFTTEHYFSRLLPSRENIYVSTWDFNQQTGPVISLSRFAGNTKDPCALERCYLSISFGLPNYLGFSELRYGPNVITAGNFIITDTVSPSYIVVYNTATKTAAKLGPEGFELNTNPRAVVS